jgi:hypothetical protein
MMIPRAIILTVWLLPLTAWCGSSQHYTLEHASLDNGGSLGASGNYVADMSGAPGGAAASVNYANRVGYAGQLADVVGMNLATASGGLTVGERGTRQLVVILTYDDASLAAAAAERVSWSVSGTAQLSISNTGVATAGAVYQDSAAAVGAGYLNFSDTLGLIVLNSGLDDFGAYASDGLADAWQVRYFGLDSAQAATGANPDGDSLTNLQEFAFGTDPSQPSGESVRWNGSTLLAAGLPVPYATNGLSGFTFRAVFSRRKDFATAGISYTAEFSADLMTWKASSSTPSVLADDGTTQVVSVPYPFFVNGKKATFFRIRVRSL